MKRKTREIVNSQKIQNKNYRKKSSNCNSQKFQNKKQKKKTRQIVKCQKLQKLEHSEHPIPSTDTKRFC